MPNEDDYEVCEECGEQFHVDNMTDGVCDACWEDDETFYCIACQQEVSISYISDNGRVCRPCLYLMQDALAQRHKRLRKNPLEKEFFQRED